MNCYSDYNLHCYFDAALLATIMWSAYTISCVLAMVLLVCLFFVSLLKTFFMCQEVRKALHAKSNHQRDFRLRLRCLALICFFINILSKGMIPILPRLQVNSRNVWALLAWIAYISMYWTSNWYISFTIAQPIQGPRATYGKGLLNMLVAGYSKQQQSLDWKAFICIAAVL